MNFSIRTINGIKNDVRALAIEGHTFVILTCRQQKLASDVISRYPGFSYGFRFTRFHRLQIASPTFAPFPPLFSRHSLQMTDAYPVHGRYYRHSCGRFTLQLNLISPYYPTPPSHTIFCVARRTRVVLGVCRIWHGVCAV